VGRNRLGAARRIVRRFCAERDIAYVEVGLFRSWVEILSGLSEAGAGAGAAVPEPADPGYSARLG
jgi:hypothetical protein